MAAGWRRRLHERAELSSHRWLWRLVAACRQLATTLIASVGPAPLPPTTSTGSRCWASSPTFWAWPLTGFWIMPWGLLGHAADAARPGTFRAGADGMGRRRVERIARHVADWPRPPCLVPSLPGASLWLMTVGGLWFCLWRRRWRLAGLPVAIAACCSHRPGARPAESEDGRPCSACAMPRAWSYCLGPHRPLHQRGLGAAQRPGRRQALAAECREQAAGLGCSTGLCPLAQGPVAHRAGE